MILTVTAIVLANFAASILLGYWLIRQRDSWLRLVLLLASAGVLLVTPWLLPLGEPFSRLVVALTVIICVHRLWESQRRVLPGPAMRSFGPYAYNFLTLPDTLFNTEDAARVLAKRRGVQRLGRGAGKLALLVGMLMLPALWLGLWDSLPLRYLWCLWAMYLVSSAIPDVAAGVNMWLSGNDAVEVFDRPYLARSPREFWGRRWNMIFRNTAHRLIFLPLLPHSPLFAAALVFLWSALVHEYVVFASLGATRGEMTMFFLVHGFATVLATRFRHRVAIPRHVAIALHCLWLWLTSPLFFSPMLQIVRIDLIRFW
jgi:Membrane bound O-acyl transferase family